MNTFGYREFLMAVIGGATAGIVYFTLILFTILE